MIHRLRVKFVAIMVLIFTLLLLIGFALVFHSTTQNLEQESIRMMQAAGSGDLKKQAPGQARDSVRTPYFVVQQGWDGTLMVVSNESFDLSDDDSLQEIFDAAWESPEDTGILRPYNLRYVKVPGRPDLRVVFADLSGEQTTLKNLGATFLLAAVLAVGLFAGVSILLARWLVKPVEQAWNQQRQFVADASHELKTPLTVILTNAEMLQSPDYDEQTRRRISGSILTMANQMRGLVEELLQLARVDAGVTELALERMDLSELVSDSVLPFEALCFEQGLELECSLEPGITVKGSESHLRQVVGILLDNAQKYADPPGTVAVHLKRQGKHCLLSVSDPGAPISPEDCKNIFKRFYRVDPARQMNHSYGLGLPIAEGIVKAHHGRIWAESAGGVNTFLVELPTV